MSAWKAKRFWTAATPVPVGDGHSVQLDGRPVKTPARALLVLPTAALAQAVAAEWDAQQGEVDPQSMPLTRAANSAIDTIAEKRAEVQAMIAAYGGSDLLCYRAEAPADLAAAQAAAWDPLLAWAAEALGAPLAVTAGIMHVAQPAASLAVLEGRLAALSPFELAAVHDIVALSGSLVIGLAALEPEAEAESLWNLSRIDETYQAEAWGEDEEAAEIAALKRSDFLQAFRLLKLCRAA